MDGLVAQFKGGMPFLTKTWFASYLKVIKDLLLFLYCMYFKGDGPFKTTLRKSNPLTKKIGLAMTKNSSSH